MPDSFFQSDKKRKRPRPSSSPRSPHSSTKSRVAIDQRPRSGPRDEDLSSDSGAEPADLDSMDFRAGRGEVPLGDQEIVDRNETAAEKRVRLAKGYLARVRNEVEAGE